MERQTNTDRHYSQTHVERAEHLMTCLRSVQSCLCSAVTSGTHNLSFRTDSSLFDVVHETD